MSHTKMYRLERVGRRIVLQVFSARPEDAPCCIFWERVRAKDVPAIRRGLAARGIVPMEPEHA